MILSDRSRYICGTKECQTKRFLNYHWQGRGVVPRAAALDLWVGILIHKCLEGIYRSALGLGHSIPPREEIRKIIQEACLPLEKEAQESGFLNEGEASEGILKEHLMLVQGLVWGYTRAILPDILRDYEILCIEQEMTLQVEEVRLQTRPDLVLRRRSDGKAGISDFKSASMIGDSYVQEFLVSPQMASCALAAQEFLGEPVEWYSIQALVKGGRKPFTKKGQLSTGRRRYSSFCYAKHKMSCPPMTEESLDLSGYWYDKTPTWEMPLEREGGKSQAEALVDLIPLPQLWENYVLIGPYGASEFLGRQFLEHLLGEERAWQQKLGKISDGASIDRVVSRSYDCFSYGSKCGYYGICFEGKSPEGGEFMRREAHHEEEAKMLEAEEEKVGG